MAGTAFSDDMEWTGFELAGQAFALPASLVGRLHPATPATPLPFAPPGVEGVANVSADVVPVVSLAALLLSESATATSGGQFLVVLLSGERFALRIDRLLFVAGKLHREAGGQAMWRGQAVTCLDATQLGLASLQPRNPPLGMPGAVAASREAHGDAMAAEAQTMVLAVEVAGNLCGLPARAVVELLEQAAVTPLPLVPSTLHGVMVLRGQPVLAFCLNRLLGHEARTTPGGHVVMMLGRSRVALVVDRIVGLQRLTPEHKLLDPECLIGSDGLALAAQMPGAAAGNGPARDGGRQRFLCVTMGDRSYALALAAIERVLPPRQSVLLPAGAPPGVDGAIEYGGRIIPLTEGWRWLSLAQAGTAAAHIVLRHEGEQRALAVNGVQRIVSIAREDILPTGGHDPRIDALGTANGRSLEILSMAALLARAEAA